MVPLSAWETNAITTANPPVIYTVIFLPWTLDENLGPRLVDELFDKVA